MDLRMILPGILPVLLGLMPTGVVESAFRAGSRYTRYTRYSGGSSRYTSYRSRTYSVRTGSSLSSRYVSYYPGVRYSRPYYSGYYSYYYSMYYRNSYMYANYRGSGSGSGVCVNYVANDNGTTMGVFSCPLPFEPNSFTACCGEDYAEYCCENSKNMWWKTFIIVAVGLVGIIVFISVIRYLYTRYRQKHRKPGQPAAPIVTRHPVMPGRRNQPNNGGMRPRLVSRNSVMRIDDHRSHALNMYNPNVTSPRYTARYDASVYNGPVNSPSNAYVEKIRSNQVYPLPQNNAPYSQQPSYNSPPPPFTPGPNPPIEPPGSVPPSYPATPRDGNTDPLQAASLSMYPPPSSEVTPKTSQPIPISAEGTKKESLPMLPMYPPHGVSDNMAPVSGDDFGIPGPPTYEEATIQTRGLQPGTTSTQQGTTITVQSSQM